MNRVHQATAATKTFVAKHKTAVTVVLTATVTTVLVLKTRDNVIAQHNEFLKAHDLYDTFYTALEEA